MTTPTTTGPGAFVRYREREWIVLPSADPDLVLLRPLGGSAREVTGVVRSLSDLIGYTLPYERIEPAEFPLPDPESAQDHSAVKLLQQAALVCTPGAGFGVSGEGYVRLTAFGTPEDTEEAIKRLRNLC